MQNLRGKYPLKSDRNGIVVSQNDFNSYLIRFNGSGLITTRNRATLRKILPVTQSDNLVFAQGLNSGQRADSVQSRVPVKEQEQDLGAHELDQVAASLLASQVDFPPLRRSSRLKTRPDIYQAGT